MTKINENGQLEWTFEDLDFEGALTGVYAELELLKKEMVIINKEIDRCIMFRDMKWLDKATHIRNILSKKHSVLYKVAGYLINLKYGGAF